MKGDYIKKDKIFLAIINFEAKLYLLLKKRAAESLQTESIFIVTVFNLLEHRLRLSAVCVMMMSLTCHYFLRHAINIGFG